MKENLVDVLVDNEAQDGELAPTKRQIDQPLVVIGNGIHHEESHGLGLNNIYFERWMDLLKG